MGVFDKISVLSFTQSILAERFMGREGWAIMNNFALFLTISKCFTESCQSENDLLELA